jgi:peptidoglycan hydrolase CwlO-like protein
MPASQNQPANTQTIGLKSLLAKYDEISSKCEECSKQLNELNKRVQECENKILLILNN